MGFTPPSSADLLTAEDDVAIERKLDAHRRLRISGGDSTAATGTGGTGSSTSDSTFAVTQFFNDDEWTDVTDYYYDRRTGRLIG